jgi:hypothetical protein
MTTELALGGDCGAMRRLAAAAVTAECRRYKCVCVEVGRSEGGGDDRGGILCDRVGGARCCRASFQTVGLSCCGARSETAEAAAAVVQCRKRRDERRVMRSGGGGEDLEGTVRSGRKSCPRK